LLRIAETVSFERT